MIEINNEKYEISTYLENTYNGKIKHACIKYPDSAYVKDSEGVYRLVKDTNSLLPSFQSLALILEPEEPAFSCSYAGKEGLVFHLIWPTNWEQADTQLIQGVGFNPIWPAPFGIYKESEKWEMYQSEYNYQSFKMLGMEELNSILIKNIELLSLAMQYLDMQTERDLTALQTFTQPELAHTLATFTGNDFLNALIWLLNHRFGPCPYCGYEVIRPYDPKRIFDMKDKDNLKGTSKVRDACEAGIWPINRNWLFGTYKYSCIKCQKKIQYSLFTKILEPAPKIPNFGIFWQPYLRAIETGSGKKIDL